MTRITYKSHSYVYVIEYNYSMARAKLLLSYFMPKSNYVNDITNFDSFMDYIPQGRLPPSEQLPVQCPGNYLFSTYTNFEKIPLKIKFDEVMNVVTLAKTKSEHEKFNRQDRCNTLSCPVK